MPLVFDAFDFDGGVAEGFDVWIKGPFNRTETGQTLDLTFADRVPTPDIDSLILTSQRQLYRQSTI
ncbi:hypothetical protein Q669_31105 [Labrenzia sp. C1B10]|nr:hypothetical protein Q669_31105 [Labrenzia sp. C1B10]ERS02984.1 hypothetical protein Q675_31570 [Labrenzia sp. C1B70]